MYSKSYQLHSWASFLRARRCYALPTSDRRLLSIIPSVPPPAPTSMPRADLRVSTLLWSFPVKAEASSTSFSHGRQHELVRFFRRGSAPIARERLQVLLSHERIARDRPDLLSILREEIVAVIGRHVSFEPDKVQIKMDRGKSVSTLAVDIEIPNRDRVLGAVSQ